MLGRRRENTKAVAWAIIDAGGRALPVLADVADSAQVNAALEKVRAALGPITILVNNTGIAPVLCLAIVPTLFVRLLAPSRSKSIYEPSGRLTCKPALATNMTNKHGRVR